MGFMGVDGIGSGSGRPLPASGAVGSSSAGSAASVEDAARPGSSREVAGSQALERLQRGEIDVGAYLDSRVSAATEHLEGALAGPELEFIRDTLRAELASDPVLVELVRRTTSGLPKKDR